MKKILIYGDSNVWGDNFTTGVRINDNNQWPNILQKKLGNEYKIFQEGLPGRLAGCKEKTKKYKNGKDTFMSTFRTNAPLDIIIISLGTNDLQLKYNSTKSEIIESLLWYDKIIHEQFEDLEDRKKYFVDSKLPEIIYILPSNFDYSNKAKDIFDENSELIRQEVISYFKNNTKYKILVPENMKLFQDGIHLNLDGHKDMAKLVEEIL